jgi:hypothetical protein
MKEDEKGKEGREGGRRERRTELLPAVGQLLDGPGRPGVAVGTDRKIEVSLESLKRPKKVR